MAAERFSSDVLQMFDESEMPEQAVEEQVLANEFHLARNDFGEWLNVRGKWSLPKMKTKTF